MTDPLSEVLRSLRLAGGVFLDAHFTAPWCVTSQITAEDCRPFLDRPAQVIAYHVVIDGALVLAVDGGPPVNVGAGEIVLLPRNDGHTLASRPGLPAVNAGDLIEPSADGGLARIVHGGGGQPTHLVCGFLGSEETHNPLIATLPRVMKLGVSEAASRTWVEATVRFAANELAVGRIASSSVMSRLSELLFVEAVRAYASALGDEAQGWLKGLRDPHVARAVALIHSDLRESWTADELAREAGLSRSVFVERFTALVGMPPIRYLTTCRLQSARLQLCETRRSIAQLAYAVGYQSEEAFSRAFKREFGLSPSQWRNRQSSS